MTDETRTPGVDVRRAGERFLSRAPGVVSRHSFSFGPHYDPGNVGFGLLVVCNDDVVQPGSGYGTHPHRDVEIVTWVLDGALEHRDSTGQGGIIQPGLIQRMSAGRGVRHSEFNASDPAGETSGRRAPLRFVQMWLPPDTPGAEPGYEQRDVAGELAGGGLAPVASGMRRHRDAAIRVGQRAAAMHVARPAPGAVLTLPAAPFVHVYVTRGTVDVESVGRLDEGDSARLTDEGGRWVRAVAPAELIVWEMHADVHAPPPPS